ncbi:hypothetical protein EBT25_11760 [bacterium]|nr:hypothetical protein [bacterium]
MKKALFAALAAISFGASAANYISVDVDTVKASNGGTNSTAQYIRSGAEVFGIQMGLQSRTARMKDGSGVLGSLEVTGGKSFGAVTPFVGVGHDFGRQSYNYGLVGATYGLSAGPGFALVGGKTRVGSTETNRTKQTVAFATYMVPVTKTVSINLNASKSFQDIKENAVGVGLGFSF